MKHTWLFALSACLAASAAAADDELAIVPALDFSYKRLQVGFQNAQSDRVSVITMIPSVSAAYGKWYVTVSKDDTIKNYQESKTTIQAGGAFANQSEADRNESTIALGYRINESISVFAGYLKGEFSLQTLSVAVNGSSAETSEFGFKESGPYIGASFSHRFEKGTLSLNGAYGKLDADLKIRNNILTLDGPGECKGYSVGLLWTVPFGQTQVLRFGVKSTRYDIEGNFALFSSVQFTGEERYDIVFFGFANYF